MALGARRIIKPIQKRGSGLCAVIDKSLLETLGWNRGDHVLFDVVNGSLVLTRVDLPKIPELRKQQEQVPSER
jgi:antitoxin component of MazEF toxin-antitoxin module